MILIISFLFFLQDSDDESSDEDEEMERNWEMAKMPVSIS